jgi:uncharacterized protein (DUF1810 family)
MEDLHMNESTRNKCTPQEYIMKLFEETKSGRLEIHYFPFFDQPYSLKYKMNWTKDDAESLVRRYDALTSSLARIGQLHEELEEESKRLALLTAEEMDVWNTYIRPFEPFEVDLDVVSELYFRRETDSLEDDENDLLERHYEWFVTNSRLRLAYNKRCPSQLINRVQRYERLMQLNAPEVVVAEEGRFLAEEMVLYYHCVKELSYDRIRFLLAQHDTYQTALEEIKNGKKCTHWMWFIFPQLRVLGVSDMAKTYGIEDADEARVYLESKELGTRLLEITGELLKLGENNPKVIFGSLDAMKLQSCMTLFAYVSEPDSVFHKVLQKYYGGEMDQRTLDYLELEDFE